MRITPLLVLAFCLTHSPGQAQTPPITEDQKEQLAAERFLELLLKRPATGTALDRVLGYHIQNGSIDQLIEKLTTEASRSTDEPSGRTWMLVGLLQLQRREDAQAAQALTKAQTQLKTNALAAFYNGQAQLLVGNMDGAIAALEEAIARQPARGDYLNVARELGRLYQREGRIDDALRVWSQLEKTFPGDDGVRARIAAALVEEGDLAGALKRYEALATSAKSENDRIAFALEVANLLGQLGQRSQAVERLNIVLEKVLPGSYLHDEARRRVERVFLASGDQAGLAEYYRQWVEKHPDDLSGLLRSARTLYLQGNNDDAIRQYRQAIERAPGEVAPRLALIDALQAERKYVDAAEQFELLLAKDPNNPDYLVKYGQTLMSEQSIPEADRRQAASQVWNRLLANRPKDATLHGQVADLLRSAGLVDEAIAHYRQAIELAPEDSQFKEYLGDYLFQLKRTDEARRVWNSLAEGPLRTRENLVRLAEVLYQFQLTSDALSVMREACQLKPLLDHRLRYAQWLLDAKDYPAAYQQIELARNETRDGDELARIFEATLKAHKAAGKLNEKISEAIAAAQADAENAERWRELARLQEAAGRVFEAYKSIQQSVKLAPKSLESLELAARLSMSVGSLPEAIELRKQLVEIDRRFRTRHWEQLARLYLKDGQSELALSAAKEMLAGAGGAIESYRTYADIAGELNRRDLQLETLRRCVQLNPRSHDAIGWLATHLAEDFKTDQAIELQWKLLDLASSYDARRVAIESLTDLYQRNNRLDQLVERLQARGRELKDPKVTADLLATVYQAANDFGLAQRTLETSLREDGFDPAIVERLVSVCEQAGELDRAIELQRELLRVRADKQATRRLASLLMMNGELEEAQRTWLTSTDLKAELGQLTSHLNSLFEMDETDAAISLCDKILEANPQAWEIRTSRMYLRAKDENWPGALADAKEILSLPLSAETRSTFVASSGNRLASGNASGPPSHLDRIYQLYEATNVLSSNRSRWNSPSLPLPEDFGSARYSALLIQMHHVQAGDPAGISQAVESFQQKAMAPNAQLQDAWDWVAIACIRQLLGDDPQEIEDPETWPFIWRLFELNPQEGWQVLGPYIVARASQIDSLKRSLATDKPEQKRVAEQALAKYKPLRPEQLAQIRDYAILDIDDQATEYEQFPRPIAYAMELELAGKSAEADAVYKEFTARKITASSARAAWKYFSIHGNDDQLWTAIDILMESKDPWLGYGSSFKISCIQDFLDKNRIERKLSRGFEDPVHEQRVLQLLDRYIRVTVAERQTQMLMPLGWIGSQQRLAINEMEAITIDFPPYGLGPEVEFLSIIHNLNTDVPQVVEKWIVALTDKSEAIDHRLHAERTMVAAILRQWQKRTDQATQLLQAAVDEARAYALPEESSLRLLLVDLLLHQDRRQEALAALDSMVVQDQTTMTTKEYAIARLAEMLGDKARAVQAVRRLLTVRLDPEKQAEIAGMMKRLDMNNQADELVRRMRQRSANSTSQLLVLMNFYSQNDKQVQAVEVARELLQRTKPAGLSGSSRQPGDRAREEALQVIAAAGKLEELVTAAEQRLAYAPRSRRVRKELIELYTAAGRQDKVDNLVAIEKEERKAFRGARLSDMIEEVATLSNAGRDSEACDRMLEILKRKPKAYDDLHYLVGSCFPAARREDEFLDLVMELGVEKFEYDTLLSTAQEWLRNERTYAKASALIQQAVSPKMLADTRAYLSSFQVLLQQQPTWLEEEGVVERFVEAQLQAGQQKPDGRQALLSRAFFNGNLEFQNPLTLCIRTALATESRSQWLEQRLREELKQSPDWLELRASLGILLAHKQQFDEAKNLLAPLADEKSNLPEGSSAMRLVAGQIDDYPPMRELALKMYELELSHQEPGQPESLTYNIVMPQADLLAEMGDKPRARAVLTQHLKQCAAQVQIIDARDDFNIRSLQTISKGLSKLVEWDGWREAVQIIHSVDRLNLDLEHYPWEIAEFDRQVERIYMAIRRKADIELLIEPDSNGPYAVSLGIQLAVNDFQFVALDSLWIDCLEQMERQSGLASLSPLAQQLKSLREKRPEDVSVQVAYAITMSASGSAEELGQLLESALLAKPAQADKSTFVSATNNALLAMAMMRWLELKSSSSSAAEFSAELERLRPMTDPWDRKLTAALWSAVGRQLIEADRTDLAKAVWTHFLSLPDQPAEQYFDLAIAAVGQRWPELAEQSVLTTVAKTKDQSTKTGGSLGELLGAEAMDDGRQPDQRETQLTQLLKLDELWSLKKLEPEGAYRWLEAWQLGEGQPLDWLNFPEQAEAIRGQDGVFDSLWDRLCIRAAQCGKTDELVNRLQQAARASKSRPDENLVRLFAAIARLRNHQWHEAQELLNAFEPATAGRVPSEHLRQLSVIGLGADESRLLTLQFAVGYLSKFKHELRGRDYGAMHLSHYLCEEAIAAKVDEPLRNTAIALYLEMNEAVAASQAGNQGNGRIYDEVATAFFRRGNLASTLEFLKKREIAYRQEGRPIHDDLGVRVLQKILSAPNREEAFRLLLDWTMAEDGQVRTLGGMCVKANSPAWLLPEYVEDRLVTVQVANEETPVITNMYVLAQLALETNQVEALISHCEKAHQRQDPDAASALAIVLATLKRSVPSQLSQDILEPLALAKTDPNSLTARMPLAELQLAVLLAGQAEQHELAAQIVDLLLEQTRHSRDVPRRQALEPWLHQLQLVIKSPASQAAAVPLKHWMSDRSDTIEVDTYLMTSRWRAGENASMRAIGSALEENQWLRYPLEGNFTLQFEVKFEQSSAMKLSAGGIDFIASQEGDPFRIEVSGASGNCDVALADRLAGQWIRHRLVLDDQQLRYFINDRLHFADSRPQTPVFVALGGADSVELNVRNLQVTGQPQISRSVDLIAVADLRDWSTSQFGGDLAMPESNLEKSARYLYDASSQSRYQAVLSPGKLAWTLRDDELISGGQPGPGPATASMLALRRPLGSGDQIEYEFYYEPEQYGVDPCLGSTAFLLKPEGVSLHWLTNTPTADVPLRHEVTVGTSRPLPLKARQWNVLQMKLGEQQVTMLLNGEEILTEAYDTRNLPTGFGLFHYTDQTRVRVRKLKLSGDWPKALPGTLVE